MIPEDDDAAAERLKVTETLSANNKRRVVSGTLFILHVACFLMAIIYIEECIYRLLFCPSVCLSVGVLLRARCKV